MNSKFKKFIHKINYSNPDNLNYNLIDSKIRKTVKLINQSSICRTLWSCQGHMKKEKDDGENLPYLVFVIKNKYKKYLIDCIFDTIPSCNNKLFPISTPHHITISNGYSDKNFSIISFHWSVSFVRNRGILNQLHRDLYSMARKINENGK